VLALRKRRGKTVHHFAERRTGKSPRRIGALQNEKKEQKELTLVGTLGRFSL